MCSAELASIFLSSGALFIAGPFRAASIKDWNKVFNPLTLLKILLIE
jgi:hypothetical protein